MKRVWIIIAVIAALMVVYGVSLYNKVVRLGIQIDGQWANVEVVLQRRFDLIPNLVESTKGYAKHEKAVFDDIAAARAAYSGAKSTGEKVKAAGDLEGAVSRLLVIVENYPNLKANEPFLKLQDELAGTENRISTERRRFNDVTGEYNKTIRQVPLVFFAKALGFGQREFFKAAEQAQKAPEVKF